MELLTIGHSNLSIEAFIALLKEHRVTAIVDVRSHPYSRYAPHFSQAALKCSLQAVGIAYVFLGKELGARSTDPTCYDEQGKVIYDRLAQTTLFAEGMKRLTIGMQKYRVALMCAEKDPIACHRSILICDRLKQQNLSLRISHILSDGTLETHEQLEERLLANLAQPPQLPELEQLWQAVETQATKAKKRAKQPTSLPLLERLDQLKQANSQQEREIAYSKPLSS
ncbi:MAG: DUF488 domain-containing protein [Cyanobacteria bacterium]|nr:DUF488 domain-containing protein [Cyanobacteriota bacterium]MDW8202421.1 DUF488 domain-containing protein [Cyanobacteriota bacterium SKYGB_h_bin112]